MMTMLPKMYSKRTAVDHQSAGDERLWVQDAEEFVG